MEGIDMIPLALLLIGISAIGLFNIVLSVTLFQLYSSMHKRYRRLLEREMKACKTKTDSSTHDGSLQEWEHLE